MKDMIFESEIVDGIRFKDLSEKTDKKDKGYILKISQIGGL